MSDYTPTAAEITLLRLRTGENGAASQYDDKTLFDLLKAVSGDQHAAAASVWEWKAAAAASLFDWSADGGDYKQSELYDRYMANAAQERAQSAQASAMIIDPTLERVQE